MGTSIFTQEELAVLSSLGLDTIAKVVKYCLIHRPVPGSTLWNAYYKASQWCTLMI